MIKFKTFKEAEDYGNKNYLTPEIKLIKACHSDYYLIREAFI